MIGPCKLCRNVGPLKESQVIPDFYIRGLEHQKVTGSKGVFQSFSFVLSTVADEEGGAKQRGHWEKILGIKEYLLCGKCEQKFSKNESYVRALLYGNDPPPLKKLQIGSTVGMPIGAAELEGILNVRRVTVDYKRLKLFQLSLLWRAGVAEGSFFQEVSLGSFHESKLRELLDTQNPGLEMDYACIMIDLQHSSIAKGCEDWVEETMRSKDSHQVSYRFIVGGYMYLFTVSKQKPRPGPQLCCVKPSGEMFILVADATKILRSRASALHKLGRI